MGKGSSSHNGAVPYRLKTTDPKEGGVHQTEMPVKWESLYSFLSPRLRMFSEALASELTLSLLWFLGINQALRGESCWEIFSSLGAAFAGDYSSHPGASVLPK